RERNLSPKERSTMNLIRNTLFTTALMLVSLFAQAAPDYWIDVRSADEFATGHVASAINIPHEQTGERIGSLTQDKSAEIWLNCKSGRRAGMALDTLKGLGYSNVRNVGGIEDAMKLSE